MINSNIMKKNIKTIIILTLFGIITGFLFVYNDTFVFWTKVTLIVIVIMIYSSILLCKTFYKIDDKYNWDRPPKTYFYVSIFLPIVGFIMWCTLTNHKPNSAKLTSKGCLCSLLLPFLTFLISLPICFVSEGTSYILRNTVYSDSYTETYNIEFETDNDKVFLDKYSIELTVTIKGYKTDIDDFLTEKDKLIPNKIKITLKDINNNSKSINVIPYIQKEFEELVISNFKDLKIIIKDKDKFINILSYSEDEEIISILLSSYEDSKGNSIKCGDNVDLYVTSNTAELYAKVLEKAQILSFFNEDGNSLCGKYDSKPKNMYIKFPKDYYSSLEELSHLGYKPMIVKSNIKDVFNVYKETDIQGIIDSDLVVKKLPIKINTAGESLREIKEIKSSVQEVTVSGNRLLIEELKYVEITIDIQGLSANKTFKVQISKPNGVQEINEHVTNVEIYLED